MEININQNNKFNVAQWLNRLFEPFTDLDPRSLKQKRIIQPLIEVKNALHRSYIYEEPLWITYEFYDTDNNIHQLQLEVRALSPVLPNLSIDLQTIYNEQKINVSLEQILNTF